MSWGGRPLCWIALAVAPIAVWGQEIDTVIYEGDQKHRSLYDQIDDGRERVALQGLFGTRDRAERSRRVREFLTQFPQSAFLSVVYEVGARSATDLSEALGLAKASLRLLPENPNLQAAAAELEGREWKPAAELARDERSAARYAGSTACRSCHPREHAHWGQTGMARMLRPVNETKIIGDFSGQAVADDQGRVLAKFGVSDRGRYIEILGKRYPVEFAIGAKWQQAYATRGPDGRLHVFPYQYNGLKRSWLNYWKRIDPAGSSRTDPANFSRFTAATEYLRNCAPCHTSQLGSEGYREAGVNCEMCHGPSADHAAQPKLSADPLAAPVQFRKISARHYLAICGQCHQQSAMFKRPGEAGLNFSGRSPTFWLAAKQRPLIEFSRAAFYRDGRFRETTFIVEALSRSACFQKGGATCGSCHNPHPPDAAANPMSLKFTKEPDRMCTQCHSALPKHTPHPKTACVDCHLPRIANSLLFKARTHFISDIPDEAMFKRFGTGQSPYVCLDCHPKGAAK